MELALQLIFWIGVAIIFYAYLGYGLLLYLIILCKRLIRKKQVLELPLSEEKLPKVTFVVAAYNEAAWIEDKIRNCLDFDYPKDKIQLLFVTDGSSDETPSLIRNFDLPPEAHLTVYHKDARRGKIAAVERIIPFINTPITIFTDANTFVNKSAIRNIVRHYENPKVGAVAGEKRISMSEKDQASAAGEGLYWKYESTLRRLDAELYSVVGAAGELFSIRTNLYRSIPSDTIIEDFFLTMSIAKDGYRVKYEPQAYAVETSSASVSEELKRKIRIAAGGLQAIYRLSSLLNVFRYGILSFQYISHRVLRWTLAPLALPMVLVANALLAMEGSGFYQLLFSLQVIFYISAFIGFILEKKQLKFKAFFVPYYFTIMNYAVYRGFFRIAGGKQSVLWERAKRA